jgi:2-polyprenyl-3-methyl-5-hydroxy-6-metoxy-1,4-benzoquinol methylase
MHLGEEMCFRAAKYLVTRRDKNLQRTFEPPFDHSRRVAGANPATFNRAAYKHWRQCELTRQFDQNFERESVRDKRVLDFGCGRGELSMYMATLGVASIDGIDLTESDIVVQNARSGREASVAPTFTVGSSDAFHFRIAIDLILCSTSSNMSCPLR